MIVTNCRRRRRCSWQNRRETRQPWSLIAVVLRAPSCSVPRGESREKKPRRRRTLLQRSRMHMEVSPNRRCLNQLNSWSEHEAAVNGATIAPPPRGSERNSISCPLNVRKKERENKYRYIYRGREKNCQVSLSLSSTLSLFPSRGEKEIFASSRSW